MERQLCAWCFSEKRIATETGRSFCRSFACHILGNASPPDYAVLELLESACLLARFSDCGAVPRDSNVEPSVRFPMRHTERFIRLQPRAVSSRHGTKMSIASKMAEVIAVETRFSDIELLFRTTGSEKGLITIRSTAEDEVTFWDRGR
jgi:hypothetical protein